MNGQVLQDPPWLTWQKAHHDRFRYQRYFSKPSILNVASKEDPAQLRDFPGTVHLDRNLHDEQSGKPLTLTDFVRGDGLCLPFRDRSFTTVVLAEVLEHMPEKAGFELLGEAFRVARERIVITAPEDTRVGTPDGDPEHVLCVRPRPSQHLAASCPGLRLARPRLYLRTQLPFPAHRHQQRILDYAGT